jgi:hypothetical protein
VYDFKHFLVIRTQIYFETPLRLRKIPRMFGESDEERGKTLEDEY